VTQWRARFTEDEIRDIRRRAEAGERHIDIAADYRAGTSTIHHIIHRESWRHVV
jgi:diketogulonate reductase-like aldo/keto reductase